MKISRFLPLPFLGALAWALPSLSYGGFTTGVMPSGTSVTGGDYKVLDGGQDYTLDQNMTGLALVIIGGRYTSSVTESGSMDGNTFRMNGSGYSFTFSTVTPNFHVGYYGGNHNAAIFSNGASLSSLSGTTVGYNGNYNSLTLWRRATLTGTSIEAGTEGGGYNTTLITGASTGATLDYLDVGYSTSSACVFNSLTIGDGAKVTCAGVTYDSTIGFCAGSDFNSVTVTGPGSSWTVGYNSSASDCLEIGSSSTDNTLTVANGGLVVLGSPALSGTSVVMTTGNYIQFANGLLAIGGNVTSSLSTLLTGYVKIWDGYAYNAVAVSSLNYAYCLTSADATAFLSSYGLSGYGYTASGLVGFSR